MSSYRSSYTPWKSSLSTNYKTGTTSTAYSSRDDGVTTPRYTSSALTTPTSYRPSFSGGTYRIKRDTPASPTTSYVSRYTSSSTPSTSSLSKPESSSISSTSQLKRYGSSSSNLGKYSREPSPAALEHTNRIRSRDPSPVTRTYRARSRDPSPALDSKYKLSYGSTNSYRMNVPKGAPPSTTYNTRYAATRTSSSTSIGEKSYVGSGTTRTPSATSLADKSLSYGNSSATRTSSSTSLVEKSTSYSSSGYTRASDRRASIPDKAISYLTASDFRTRTKNDTKEEENCEADAIELEQSPTKDITSSNDEDLPPKDSPEVTEPVKVVINEEQSETTEESDTSEDEELAEPAEQFLTITVCTRGTSPNPPGATPNTNVPRSGNIAHTIEKTMLRSTKKRKMLEKEMQSDRLDDSSKYSRYALNSRLSPYSSRSERFSPSNLRYSSSPLSSTSKSITTSTNESRREDSTTSSSSISKATKAPAMKSKLSPPKVGKHKSRQSSMESLSPHKPPVGPKIDSPQKSSSPSAISPPNIKIPNKDFRKSALNVGPTDRSRKSRTPSTGTDSDFNTVDALNGALQAIRRLERSPSNCSEISNASNRSIRNRNITESKLRPRCHNKPLGSRTPPSPLSRQNSATSFKQKTTPVASPLAARSTKILVTTAISSSSGTESSADLKKPHKKIVKKKANKDVISLSTTTSTTTTLSSSIYSDSQSEKSSQPPVASAAASTKIAVASGKTKKSESSAIKKSASASSRTEKDPLRRLKKLSSVSNFFVTQQNNSNSDEQIHLESSENSGGGSGAGGGTSTDLDAVSSKSSKKSISIKRTNEPKISSTKSNGSKSASNCNSPIPNTRSSTDEQPTRKAKSSSKSTASSKSKSKSKSRSTSVTSSSYCPQNSSTLNEYSRMPTEMQSESLTTTATTSNTATDSEEASWWQDTSRQIDTSSALDFSPKDEPRFKVRHFDSGEVGWWLRNDEDDTLADDLATLNQDDDDDVGTEIFDEDDNEDILHPDNEKLNLETKDKLAGRLEIDEHNVNEYQNENLDYPTNVYHNQHLQVSDNEYRPFPRSRLTPETDWWNDDDDQVAEETSLNASAGNSSDISPKQNGTIQLKIIRVESGETLRNTQEPIEEPAETVRCQESTDATEQSSSITEPKNWLLSAPTTKLFNLPRVESGEKAWWLGDSSGKESQRSKSQDPEKSLVDNATQPQTLGLKKFIQISRVDSGEKAWWQEEGSDKETKRSKSRDIERSPIESNASSQERLSSSPSKKFFNIRRVDSQENVAWWQENEATNEPKRSSSQDSEKWLANSPPTRREQVRERLSSSPSKKLYNICSVDSEENATWWQENENKRSKSQDSEQWLNNTAQTKVNQVPNTADVRENWLEDNDVNYQQQQQLQNAYQRQQSLEEQKQRWLQQQTRQYQDQSANPYYQSSEDFCPKDELWLENQSQDHGYQTQSSTLQSLKSNDDIYHEEVAQPFNHRSTFSPQNRADSQTELSNSFNFEYSERLPPLGQCASPVHQDEEEQQQTLPPPPQQRQHCSSPYDNIPMTKVQQTTANTNAASASASDLMPISAASPRYSPVNNIAIQNNSRTNNNVAAAYQQEHLNQQQPQQYLLAQQATAPTHLMQLPSYPNQTPHIQNYNNNDLRAPNGKLFISRHQNIDELLSGTACRPISPLFFENGSFQTMPPTQRNMFIEEITPDQVRIHDSTAQVPYIQRMERDSWERDSQKATNSTSPPRCEQRMIDDAALQVYKDGDYGAYLDLESSLAEQAEEIEGLNSSRKNSLVVRTQLSVRVHAIIEKLLSAEGSDLRRALFSLKQVFQEDKDLVHAFVALGGLNCLVRVGNGADQNYQNYILRALGQVMLYVDGMNGVMKHEPTMQWLYSLIASNYRSVVKTALKLLLVFVEYAESNCHVLVSAIHAVDKQQGTLPWSNIMRLLKDYDNADAELVIYAASLINKTLEGLNDQDSFYDESDLLEQQGMESVIQHYMSKPGTDMDLLNQLQLYEAVLKFEDGESDGFRLPDNTLRKTQRFRNSTDTAERRKSRRHSTGTSPGNIKKILPTNARLTPTQPALDEDSSSSTNSAEFAGGVFVDKNHRDGAGVTPGLRRRRERAERHRSFLKEQQEAAAAVAAAANGYLNGLDKREDLGQLVTAIPATIKSGDSPPESLNIIPECNGSPQHNQQQQQNASNSNGIGHNHISNNSSSNNKPFSFNNHSNAAEMVSNHASNATNNNHNANSNASTNNINNSNHHINLLSPTKQLLGTNTISIINNSFDKSNTNKLQQHGVNGTPADFYNKKNLFMERNATVINGIMKNIQRNNSTPSDHSENIAGTDQNLINYKKFENNANRLNTYYNQINNSTPKNQNHNHQQYVPTSPLSPTTTTATPTSPLASYSIPSSPQKTAAANALAAVLSPKKILNCSSPTSAGFDFTPPKSTTPLLVAAAEPAARELFEEMPNETVSTAISSPINTPSSQSSPVVAYTMEPVEAPIPMAYNTMSNRAVVPPPPPPPPPPPLPDFGFLRPINFYNNNSNNNSNSTTITTTTTTATSSSTSTNFPNNTNNTSNSNNITTDAVDYLQINESDNEDKKRLMQLKRDHTVKDLTQKLSNLPTSPTHEEKLQNRIVGDMTGLISKAKEGLAKSKSKGEVSRGSSVDQEIKKVEPKKSENELQWEELVRNMARPLNLCDLDFTDLNSEDEKDILAPKGSGRGVPPPPPPMGGVVLPPPMMPTHIVLPPPMMSQSNMSNGSGCGVIPPPMLSYSGYGNSSLTNSFNSSMNGSINGDTNTIRKNKKTVKLFWKEVREDLIPVAIGKTIWDELPSANVDTQKLEHLFESRAKDLMTKKQHEINKSKEVIVLDHKRSNAINIAMTKLPPPRAIKAAILKMDATVVTREGIDKLLNMLPTDEEKGKIQEAQMANPELPLGSAEQFLLTLASISELAARLRLWAFRLDFDNSEKEIAEPLMDLKHGIEILRNNRTFKCILSTLLSVGIFLNGAPVKGFQIEYLAKVPEVKDTVHKHSLLHHLCHIVMESGQETTDLYSEIGPITRASKADFNDLAHQLSQLEHECKTSWDRLKLIGKHDCPPQLKQKLVDFLADCAERIIILQIVHRRVMNRYRKFLLWLGVPQHSVADSRPNEFSRVLSEFALEYRTTRERVQQQIEKKANHRERNKTRGKLIVDIAKFKTKEDKQDDELKQLLGTPSADSADGTLTWRRRRAENLRSPTMRQSEENFTDGDDEILESLVKTATKAPGTRTTPRERKRTRHADRKSLRRTLKNGLTEEEKLQVAALIKTY